MLFFSSVNLYGREFQLWFCDSEFCTKICLNFNSTKRSVGVVFALVREENDGRVSKGVVANSHACQ